MKKLVFIMSLAAMATAFLIAVTAFRPAPVFERKQKLSEYNYFTGPLAGLKPVEGVVPYELNTALFSNYAEKLRFVKLPPGTKAAFVPEGALDFPKGTVFIKNFYYPK